MNARARRIAQAAQRPALKVIGGGGATRTAFLPIAVAIVVGIFGVAALQAYLGQEGFRAARIERELEEAEQRYALLRAQVAELSTPSRLEEQASESGMVAAPEPTYLSSTGPVGERPDTERADYAAKRFVSGGR